VRAFLAAPVALSLLDLPWTPLFLAAIFVFHPALGWLALGGGAILMGAAALNRVLARRARSDAAEAAARLARQAGEAGGFVAAQGMAEALRARWGRLQDAAVDAALRDSDRTGAIAAFVRAFRLLLQSAMLAAGAWLVLGGALTAGAMIAASVLLGRALAPLDACVAQWPAIAAARAGWRGLRSLPVAAPAPPTALPTPEARLEARGLGFLPHPGAPPVLDGVSFVLEPGEALGVIGRSGAGKTTLARLLTGALAPTSGEVRLGGAPLARYGEERLGALVGYLPQEVRLFDGTVAENIARMEARPDDARVVGAARAAGAHGIVLSLPQGYETQLDGTAPALSGGQRQRLALARALYGDPVLLVLDEPSSALDADGADALNAAIAAMKAEGRAVLVMTHRPTALAACDRLLVLEGGRVTALGPRDEILGRMLRNAGDVARALRAGGA
jgi:PrtD family type I secretion system ABC transporter